MYLEIRSCLTAPVLCYHNELPHTPLVQDLTKELQHKNMNVNHSAIDSYIIYLTTS